MRIVAARPRGGAAGVAPQSDPLTGQLSRTRARPVRASVFPFVFSRLDARARTHFLSRGSLRTRAYPSVRCRIRIFRRARRQNNNDDNMIPAKPSNIPNNERPKYRICTA